MRSFLVRAGEEVVILQPVKNEVTGTMSRVIRYYNGTGRGDYIVIGDTSEELFIAHVTAEGSSEINAMDEPERHANDAID